MKKLILTISLFLASIGIAQAGNNENSLNLSVGYLLPKSYTATVAFEHEYLYQHGLEVFADYNSSYSSAKYPGENQLLAGAAYKLPMARFKNSMIRLRIGIKGGSNFENFIYGPELGFEYAFCFGSKLQITLQQKNELTFGATRKFHSGITAGFRLPF